MGIPNVFRTGISGMNTSKAAVATTGHNIANANAEGFSRQRVQITAGMPAYAAGSQGLIGTGSLVQRVERVNDDYIEKQLRNGTRDLSHMEEKDVLLRQTEDIFNEMNGDGLNRLVARFFNEFRKLSNEPDSEAVRQSVREASQAMVNDFHRLRTEVEDVRRHIDARLEGYSREINSLTSELKDLNLKIRNVEVGGASPNDLLDKRDLCLKQLASFMDISTHKDNHGNVTVDLPGLGPLVSGGNAEPMSVERSPDDGRGKPEGAMQLHAGASATGDVTHSLKGGKLGALLEVRDHVLSTVLDRLDDMALTVSQAVNGIHAEGFTRNGLQGVAFFKPLEQKHRAAEFIGLSDAVRASVNNIATAAQPDSPGDNRIALAIADLQNHKIMGEGRSNMDDWYNSIVSDVGVASNRNKAAINQHKDIMVQLGKMRDQISGVSLDEETANLMQFQQAYGASAKVIQVADEMLKTVLEMKR